MEENEQPKKSVIAKLIEFYLKHKAICTPLIFVLAIVIGAILLVIFLGLIMQPIFDGFGLFYGIRSGDLLGKGEVGSQTSDTTSEKYKNITLEELQNMTLNAGWSAYSCYRGKTDGFFAGPKAFFRQIVTTKTQLNCVFTLLANAFSHWSQLRFYTGRLKKNADFFCTSYYFSLPLRC